MAAASNSINHRWADHQLIHSPRHHHVPAPFLPPEIIDRILSFLEVQVDMRDQEEAGQRSARVQRDLWACTLVNRQWNACTVQRLWKNPLIMSPEDFSRFVECCAISQNAGAHVLRLDTSLFRVAEPRDTLLIRSGIGYMPNLRLLKMSCDHFRAESLDEIFDRCQDIQLFSLSGTPEINLNAPLQHQSILNTHGDLWDFKRHPGTVRGIRKLSALCLNNVTFVEEEADFYWLLYHGLDSNDSGGNNLVHLNLGRTWVTDAILAPFAEVCPRLQSIVLEENSDITDWSIERLAKSCQQLRFVKLRNAIQVGDRGVICLVTLCRNLAFLGISYTGCTDETLRAITAHAKNLHTLFMNDLNLSSEKALIDLITKRGPQLKTLGMASIDVVSKAFCVTLAKHCPNLEELDIAGCNGDMMVDRIDEESADLVVNSCPKLRTFLVGTNDGISDAYLARLSEKVCIDQFWLPPPDELTGADALYL
ncbi:hypothetical protein DFJ77DRAFT_12453 [Powellomyces hirtus]|nr:hypothetical protein DFJ77DRAFT_12453 [Powellomyces hirtus]